MGKKKVEAAAPEAVQEQKVVAVAPAKECTHPEDQASTVERADGSGKWDRVCGVCGFVMCEVGKPAPCIHPPFTRNWRTVETDVEGLFCDCGHDCGDRRLAPGKSPLVPDNDPETEAAVKAAEKDLGLVQCHNNGCKEHDTTQVDNCQLTDELRKEWGDETPGVTACDEYSANPDPETGVTSQEVPAGAGELTSPFTSDAPGPDDIAGQVVATGEGAERREEFVPAEKSTSYVTREPHRISPRFQELLPVPVDDEDLGKLGQEMAEQFGTWRKTKLDLKKFTKACKEVTDRCEARMVELEEIIQDQARMESIDVHWEYDYTAGEKVLRRCDTWGIVKRETLTVEERQMPLDLDNSSAKAVEKLREIQQTMAGDAVEDTPLTDDTREEEQEALEMLQALLALVGLDVPLEILSAQSPEDLESAKDYAVAAHLHASDNEDVVVPPLPAFIQQHHTTMTAGELVGNGYPLHPDQVGEELQAVQQQANPEAGLDQETINLRDEFCEGWRNCAEVALCMGPENTTGQCYHVIQEETVEKPVETVDNSAGFVQDPEEELDPLGAALADEG